MNPDDMLTALTKTLGERGWGPILLLLLFLELRALPAIFDMIGWAKAHAMRAGVTAEDAAKHRPSSPFRRPPLPPIALVLLLPALGACACPASDLGPPLERAVGAFVSASEPSADVPREEWEDAARELKRAANAVTAAHRE